MEMKVWVEPLKRIIRIHEERLVNSLLKDTRQFSRRRYARTRANVDREGFVVELADFEPDDCRYRSGVDVYLYAVSLMEKMCVSRRGRANVIVSDVGDDEHRIAHLFVYSIFGLAKRERGYMSPLGQHGRSYYARECVVLYRRQLLGIVKYLVEKDVARYVSNDLFHCFLSVFGNYQNWVVGRTHATYDAHEEYMPFYGDVLSNLAELLSLIEKEMTPTHEGEYVVCCYAPFCPIAGRVDRFFS